MACVCAKFNEYWEWKCDITGDQCFFMRPNQDACADMYGEVEHTKKWEKEHENEDQIGD